MARIDIDLSGFAATRASLDQVATRQRAADAEVAAARQAAARSRFIGGPFGGPPTVRARRRTGLGCE